MFCIRYALRCGSKPALNHPECKDLWKNKRDEKQTKDVYKLAVCYIRYALHCGSKPALKQPECEILFAWTRWRTGPLCTWLRGCYIRHAFCCGSKPVLGHFEICDHTTTWKTGQLVWQCDWQMQQRQWCASACQKRNSTENVVVLVETCRGKMAWKRDRKKFWVHNWHKHPPESLHIRLTAPSSCFWFILKMSCSIGWQRSQTAWWSILIAHGSVIKVRPAM